MHKKVSHYRATRLREGPHIQSAFAKFSAESFTHGNFDRHQSLAAGLIAGIMHNPGTVILRGRTVDLINSEGQGVRINSQGLFGTASYQPGQGGRLFTGFVDAMLYTDPKNIPQRK